MNAQKIPNSSDYELLLSDILRDKSPFEQKVGYVIAKHCKEHQLTYIALDDDLAREIYKDRIPVYWKREIISILDSFQREVINGLVPIQTLGVTFFGSTAVEIHVRWNCYIIFDLP